MGRSKNILITGSCGFIGFNLMRKLMKEGGPYLFSSVDQVLDKYNMPNAIENYGNHQFYMGDIADEQFMDNVFALTRPDYVLHLAAQSFVDASITSAGPFIHSNVVGTQVLVDMSVKYNIGKFIYVSTDEVYGQLNKNDPSWTEENNPYPRNPYSASKYAGEIILQAAHQTHGLRYNITRCCNTFGTLQPPRNLCPKILTCLLNNQPIPIHGDGSNIREWIDVRDHCSALMTVLEKGQSGEIYNIGSGLELSNMEMVKYIAQKMNKLPEIKWMPNRKGHDSRYSVNCDKLKKLGWAPQYTLDQTLDHMIEWYIAHQDIYK